MGVESKSDGADGADSNGKRGTLNVGCVEGFFRTLITNTVIKLLSQCLLFRVLGEYEMLNTN